MAMGFILSDEFDSELRALGLSAVQEPSGARGGAEPQTPDNLASERDLEPSDPVLAATSITVVPIEHGRGLNKTNVPPAIRNLIAEESLSGAPASELQRSFGISQSSISAYKQGATSTSYINQPTPELKKHVDITKLKIKNSARARLETALNALTNEKISSARAKDISAIAKDMSAVMRDQEDVQDDDTKVQVVIYQPRKAEEDEFESIVVHE